MSERPQRVLVFATLRLPGPIAANTRTPTNFDILEDVRLIGINWQASLAAGAVVRQAQLIVEVYSNDDETEKRIVPYHSGVSLGGGSAVAKEFRFRKAELIRKGERIKTVDISADALLVGEEYGSAKEFIVEA